MSKSNPEHVSMFTFTPKGGFTATSIHSCTEAPPFVERTGDHDIDILFWVRSVLGLEDAHLFLEEVEVKLDEMKSEPASAILHYVDKLRKSGSEDFEFLQEIFKLNSDWKGSISWMRENKEKTESIINKFGSREAVFELTLPEKLIVEEYGYLYEICDEESELRESVVSGFRRVLPSPVTLSDVVREWKYWMFILDARRQVKSSGTNTNKTPWWWDRLDFLVQQLMHTKPVTRTEALAVCQWLLHECSYFSDRDGDEFDSIILNLVGECEE